jgi:hypothetical protein
MTSAQAEIGHSVNMAVAKQRLAELCIQQWEKRTQELKNSRT